MWYKWCATSEWQDPISYKGNVIVFILNESISNDKQFNLVGSNGDYIYIFLRIIEPFDPLALAF